VNVKCFHEPQLFKTRSDLELKHVIFPAYHSAERYTMKCFFLELERLTHNSKYREFANCSGIH